MSKKTHVLAYFDITPSANTATSMDGRTTTLPYFLSTLPKSWLSAASGKNGTVSLKRLKSIAAEHRIWLNIRRKNSLASMPTAKGKNPSFVRQAEARHWVRHSLMTVSESGSSPKCKKYSPIEATLNQFLEAKEKSGPSETGHLGKSEKSSESRC